MPSCAVRLLLAAGVLVLTGCTVAVRNPIAHQVQLGDTLFSIAFHYGLDWRELADWNGITAPYRIYAGQSIELVPPGRGTGDRRLPVVEDRPTQGRPIRVVRSEPASVPQAAVPRTKVQPLPPASPAPKPTSAAASRPAPAPAPAPARQGGAKWLWPTKGEVVTPFSPTNGKKGVDIRGKLGQAVAAAAEGDVVYSGKGLIGYGNLIIIKHDDIWLSAYGHNSTLLVREGDRVRAGQKIAEMGQNGKSGSILHFEIRKNGTPVDPARYLPKQ